jgi:hypothetical protein
MASLTDFWWINRWAMEEVRKLQSEEALDSSAVRLGIGSPISHPPPPPICIAAGLLLAWFWLNS